jgi:hypothetical protein
VPGKENAMGIFSSLFSSPLLLLLFLFLSGLLGG